MMTRTKAKYDSSESPLEIKNRQLAYEAAKEGIVLLENKGILPLAPGKVALYGMGAAINIKGGTGSGEVNERHSVGIQEGLENAGFVVTTNSWLEDYREEFNSGKQAYGGTLVQKIMSENPDDRINIMDNPYHYPFGREITSKDLKDSETNVCIFVISRQAGECADRKLEEYDYTLSEVEIKNIEAAGEYYDKLVLVINVGGSMDISGIKNSDRIGAVLYYCQQGMEGGNALADIITGKAVPSGCLTDTWVNTYEDIPYANEYSYLNGNVDEENYSEGIFVGYRYFDTCDRNVKYEFGYGKSYTSFDIDYRNISSQDSKITVAATVKNTGEVYSGKKVIQLYMSCPGKKMVKEYQNLVAFTKTGEIAPGEYQNTELQFDMVDFASYDEEYSQYILEAGDYILRLGESSRKTKVCAIVHLEQDYCIEQCKAIQAATPIEMPAWQRRDLEEDVSGVERITLDKGVFSTIVHKYGKAGLDNEESRKMLSKLTVDEKVQLVMGTGVMGMNPYFNAPGAAAFSADFPEKGIANMVFCDGPAGLRLQKRSVIDDNGEIRPLEPMMEFLNYLPKEFLSQMLGDPEHGTCVYQYATAFPVGTALAQTWNEGLLEKIGKAVGEEMQEYGVTFWLAPGMNIHRNPLCGRNYEYFSEDPYLTGVCAAALTRGVQSNDGCFVTLKHFVANNQESNRNHVSSNMNERTLREIYLKGFKIAVQKGHAQGVMTGYNRVNGSYTSENKEICTGVLRDEWGFEGLIMTDWFATGKGLADNAQSLKAGVDLIMPGGEEYRKKLEEALEKGDLEEEDLDNACMKILSMLLKSQVQKEYFN